MLKFFTKGGRNLPPFSILKLILLTLVFQFLLFISAWFNDILVTSTENNDGISFDSFTEKLFLVLLIAPLLETLLFNLALNELIFKISKRKTVTIIISSMLFGLTHWYGLSYLFFGFLAGLIFNTYYFLMKERYNIGLSTILVLLLHFNHNLIGVLLEK